MVVDLGGGTVDITVHEKRFDGTLKQLVRANGNDCGGTSVDNEFYQLMIRLFGAPLLLKMKSASLSDYLSLLKSLNAIKKTINPKKTEKVNFVIPCSTLDNLCRLELEENICDTLGSSHLNVTVVGDKMRIEASLALSFFKSTNFKIVALLKSILKQDAVSGITDILLVGGFAECKVVHTNLKTAFPTQNIVLQEDPGSCVLKGALLFGYKPDYISERIARYTYGINTTIPFDNKKHPIHRKTIIKGKEKCENVFDPFIKANTPIPLGKTIEKVYYTYEKFQQKCVYEVFYSEEEEVLYTDGNDSTRLGYLTFENLDPTEHLREMKAIFHFGDTEFTVTVEDVESGSLKKMFFEIKD